MKIVISVGELLDRDKWLDFCELMQMGVWTINEGVVSTDGEFTLTVEQAAALGLIKI